MELPEEMTPAIKDVLSLMVFTTGPTAECLRQGGHNIARKCEDEQAYVLWWCLKFAIQHGDKWRDFACDELNRIKDKVKGLANK